MLKAEKARLSTNAKRRPAHLLSGLLRCGCCGSGLSVHDRDKTGKTRIRCSAVRENGSCSNRRIFYLQDVEEAVLRGMAEELKDTRLIETYVRAYNEERKRLAATAISRRARIERRRDRLEAERLRTIGLLIKGVLCEEEGRVQLNEVRAKVREAERELSLVEETPQIVALHSRHAGQLYRHRGSAFRQC